MHLVVWITCDEPPRLGGLHVSVSQKFGSPTPAEGWHTCTQLRIFFSDPPPPKKKTFLGTQKFHEHLKFASSPFYHILTLFYDFLPLVSRFAKKPDLEKTALFGESQEGEITGQGRQELNGWSYVGGFLRGSRFRLDDTKALVYHLDFPGI